MRKLTHCSRLHRGKQATCIRQKPPQERQQEQQEPRLVMIGLADAQALVLILKTWLSVLQKMAEQAPELHADVFSLRSLLLRLGRFGEQDDELLLTYFDLEAIDLALTGFGDLLRQKVHNRIIAIWCSKASSGCMSSLLDCIEGDGCRSHGCSCCICPSTATMRAGLAVIQAVTGGRTTFIRPVSCSLSVAR